MSDNWREKPPELWPALEIKPPEKELTEEEKKVKAVVDRLLPPPRASVDEWLREMMRAYHSGMIQWSRLLAEERAKMFQLVEIPEQETKKEEDK